LRQQQSDQVHIFGVVLDSEVKLVIDEALSIPEQWFTTSDRLAFNQFPPHRRNTRLAGQAAVKQLLHKIYALPPQSTVIKHYPSGAPYAEVGGRCYDISVSHLAGYGAAALSLKPDDRVGIDLVQRRVMDLEGLIDKTLDSVEQGLIRDHKTDFFSLWALKEAALKTWQVGMRVPIWDVHVRTMGRLHQIEADGFTPLCGTTIDLSSQLVLGVTWGAVASAARWVPRGLHMGC
jgi:phosphopantetheinyl transferase